MIFWGATDMQVFRDLRSLYETKIGMVALTTDHAVYKFIFMKTSNLKKVARSIVIIMKIITTFSPRPLIGRGKGVSHEWPCLKICANILTISCKGTKNFLHSQIF